MQNTESADIVSNFLLNCYKHRKNGPLLLSLQMTRETRRVVAKAPLGAHPRLEHRFVSANEGPNVAKQNELFYYFLGQSNWSQNSVNKRRNRKSREFDKHNLQITCVTWMVCRRLSSHAGGRRKGWNGRRWTVVRDSVTKWQGKREGFKQNSRLTFSKQMIYLKQYKEFFIK